MSAITVTRRLSKIVVCGVWFVVCGVASCNYGHHGGSRNVGCCIPVLPGRTWFCQYLTHSSLIIDPVMLLYRAFTMGT